MENIIKCKKKKAKKQNQPKKPSKARSLKKKENFNTIINFWLFIKKKSINNLQKGKVTHPHFKG